MPSTFTEEESELVRSRYDWLRSGWLHFWTPCSARSRGCTSYIMPHGRGASYAPVVATALATAVPVVANAAYTWGARPIRRAKLLKNMACCLLRYVCRVPTIASCYCMLLGVIGCYRLWKPVKNWTVHFCWRRAIGGDLSKMYHFEEGNGEGRSPQPEKSNGDDRPLHFPFHFCQRAIIAPDRPAINFFLEKIQKKFAENFSKKNSGKNLEKFSRKIFRKKIREKISKFF